MTTDVLRSGDLSLLFRQPDKSDFEIAPVWCEYYEPSELEDINVDRDWIESNLLIRLNSSNDRAYYAVNAAIDYSKREFLCVYCQLVLNSLNLDGYLFLSAGEITSVTIFLDNEAADLYGSELLGDDNVATLHRISEEFGVDLSDVNNISYNVINNPVKELDSVGCFSFSTEEE